MYSYKVFIAEMQHSDTADKLGIVNCIPKELDSNCRALFDHYMSLRDLAHFLSYDIIITSGYRCTRLNKAVGGVSNSNHLSCRAFDFAFKGVSSKSDFLKVFNNIKFQYIKYYESEYDEDYRAALQRFNHHFIVYPDRLFVHYQIITGFMCDNPIWYNLCL